MITKRRLHVIYSLMCFMTAMELGGSFLFLRKDFTRSQMLCITANILDNAAFYTSILVDGGILGGIMVVSFIWLNVKVYVKKKNIKPIFNNRTIDGLDNASELKKALVITLAVYICLYLPTVVCFLLRIFVHTAQLITVMDACMLIYFISTFVNPYIYYATLKDFREGYKQLVLCKTTKIKPNQPIELATIEL